MVKRQPLLIGEYKYYDKCRFCLKDGLKNFIDFGFVPLAGGFLHSEKEFSRERLYPFAVCICSSCGLVQGRYVVDKQVLFEEYFYRSSTIGTLVEHFEHYAHDLKSLLGGSKDKFVVEIGSNDGVFLKPLNKIGFNVLGVDPAKNIVSDLDQKLTPTLCAYFGEKSASQIFSKYGGADAIVSSNSFAHIDDMQDVMKGVVKLLKPDGILCVENQYIVTLMQEFQYDLMYHEHMSYYSLTALQEFFSTYDMEIFDAHSMPMHASTMRYFVQKKLTGGRAITKNFKLLLKKELQLEIGKFKTFKAYSGKIKETKVKLLAQIKDIKSKGKIIYGYGASGRATMVMSYCGLGLEHMQYVIDDSPVKQGAFTPGNHIPIVSSKILSDPKLRPDYCLLFAWAFAKEVVERNQDYIKSGGKFIVPLPEVKIIP